MEDWGEIELTQIESFDFWCLFDELCDDNNDGVECFDLHTKDAEICPNCAQQGATIIYSLDPNFTTPLPNIYCNTVNPQVIYAFAMSNGCGSTNRSGC